VAEAEETLHSGNKYMTQPRQEKDEHIALLLLQWFEKNKGEFPWRPAKSPYQAAIAEVLFQKTSATSARPIYELFVRSYPTVYDLATAVPADLEQLLRPLGMPRRSLLIQQLAIEVVTKHGGRVSRCRRKAIRTPWCTRTIKLFSRQLSRYVDN
jgi:adenine-specific DNA glycosylase